MDPKLVERDEDLGFPFFGIAQERDTKTKQRVELVIIRQTKFAVTNLEQPISLRRVHLGQHAVM